MARSVLDFFREDGLMLAGSMSYFLMMALIPFCLFLVALFGHFLGNFPEFYRFFVNKVINFFPSVTREITGELAALISYKGIGKVSLVLYGLMSYQVFASLESSLNTLFHVSRRRPILVSLLLSLVFVTLISALLILSFVAASIIPLLASVQPFGIDLHIGMIKAFLIRFVVPFILVLFTVMMTYLLVPRTKVNAVHAFWGALFTTTLFEIAKHVFTWYVGTAVHFGRIYGPLSAFIVFLLWVFYSSSIFLIGAKVVYNAGNGKGGR